MMPPQCALLSGRARHVEGSWVPADALHDRFRDLIDNRLAPLSPSVQLLSHLRRRPDERPVTPT
jgi:hypothetical protein